MDRAAIKGMRILLFLALTAVMLFGAGASFTLAQDDQIQSVELLPSSSDQTAGASFSLSAMYTVGNSDNTLTGIGIRIHFDSSKLQFTGFSNPFSTGLMGADSIAQDDTQDYDNDVSTDKYVGIAWASLGGDWPNEALPLELVQVGFIVNSQATSGVTSVNVSFSSVAAGYTGDATNATVSVSGTITTGSITGTVNYTDYTSGTIYIGAFSDEAMTQFVGGTSLSSPGDFTIADLNPATYYVGAYVDLDGNGQYGEGEPSGTSSNNPITVQADQSADAGTITIAGGGGEPTTGSISGTVNYPDYTTGTIYIGAYTTSPPSGPPVSGTSLTSLTDGSGTYEITGLDPGHYYVFGYFDANGNGYQDPNEPVGAASDSGFDVVAGTSVDAGTFTLAVGGGVGPGTGTPIAVAGIDFTAVAGNTVTLDGSHSQSATTYTWTQTAGDTVTLAGANSVTPTFTPSAAGTYTFQLVVSNGTQVSNPDTITVTVVAAGTEEASIIAMYANFNTAINNYLSGTGSLDDVMAYFSDSFLDDGDSKDDMSADFQDMLGNATSLEMYVNNIQVDGTSATAMQTIAIQMSNEWGEPFTEFDTWTMHLRKENDTWKAYGNQNAYDVLVNTIKRSDGSYTLNLKLNVDPGQVNTVSVSGPGIDGSISLYDDGMHHDDMSNDGNWGNVISLTSPPTVGDTYSFTIDGVTVNSSVTGTMTGVATNGTVSEQMPPTFYWDPAEGAVCYTIQVFNASDGSLVWEKRGIPSPFVEYMGPPLFVNQTYQWRLLSFDINENASESALFSFMPTTGPEGGDKSISGTVYGPDGTTPLANIWVNAWSDSAMSGFGAQTNANGEYTISNLVAASDYRVDVWSESYAHQFYKKADGCDLPAAVDGVVNYANCGLDPVGTSDWGQATLVDLFVNSASGVNFIMSAGVSISGTVKDSSGNGVGRVWINAWSESTGGCGGAETNPDGTYTISGLVEATDYRVEIQDDVYAHQFYMYQGYKQGDPAPTNNDYSALTPVGTNIWDDATLVSTSEGAQAQGVNFVVSEGKSISGLVLADGSPVANVWVNAWSESQMTGNGAQTNQNGEYTIRGLAPASDYRVDIWSERYTYQVYNNKTDWMNADLVDISQTDAVNINFNLGSGYSISGRVVDETGQGVSGVWVNAHSETTGFGKGESTDANGNYTISGLAAASDYRVDIWAEGYVSQFYNGKTDWMNADLVDITSGSVTGIDFTLSAGVYIEGTITLPEGATAADYQNCWVNAWSQSTGGGGGAPVNDDGTYRISGLPSAADYKVDVSSDKYGHKFWAQSGSVSDWMQAGLVSTEAGSVSNIDITLSGGNSITGTITGLGSGDSAWVNAWSDSKKTGNGTNVTGTGGAITYTINGLDPASDYKVEINSDKYQNQFYNGQTDWMNADLVDVSSGNATGIDFNLSTGTSISGTVKDTEGNGIPSVWVDAWSETGSWGGAMTDSEGNFTINGLTDGAIYTVNVSDPNYAGQSQTVTAGSTEAGTVVLSVGSGVSISGSVTDGNGNPIAGAWVNAWSDSNMTGRGEPTDANGNYTIKGLTPASDYRVDVWAEGYASQFYNGVTMWDQADLVDTTGGSVTGIDFTLSSGNTISGTITIPEGGNTNDIWVNAWSETKGGMGTSVNTWNGNIGTYEITGLVAGNDYKVDVWSPNYQHVFYKEGSPSGVSDWMQASSVDISAGDATNINFTLSAGNSISGTVTAGGSPVANVWVNAGSDSAGSWNGANTDSEGKYTITGLAPASDYKVDVFSDTYAHQFYNGKTDWMNADLVDITSGSVTGIDFTLSAGVYIEGTITLPEGATAADYRNCWVNAWSESTGSGAGAPVNDDGTYRISGLPSASDYKVDVWSDKYGHVFYKNGATNNATGDWMQATEIDVTSGAASDINITLTERGTISGNVKDSNGDPIQHAWVNAWSDAGGNGAETDANGDYTIKGLPPSDSYKVDVWADGYVHMFYNNQTDFMNADLVDITSGNAEGIDFVLGSGNSISGTVTAEGSPVANIWVNAWSESAASSGGAPTDSNGNYTITGLAPANDYVVDVWSDTYAHQFYNQKTDWEDADKVDISTANQTGINFNLSRGNYISGQITLPEGDSDYSKIWVNAWSDTTASGNGSPVKYDGTYKIAGLVPGGGYKVDVWSDEYVHVFYKDGASNNTTTDWDQADTIDISSDNATGINLTLESGGSISGTVYLPDGTTPASGVWVDASSSTTGAWGGIETASDGTYTINGLVPGDDYVVSTWSSEYANVSQTGVSTGETVNLTLSAGVSISGALKDSDGNGISGVWIDAWSDAEGVGGGDTTASDGSFTISGLKPNTTYTVSAATGEHGFISVEVPVGSSDVSGVDLQIAAGASISGTVTKASDGGVITDVEVIVAAFDSKGEFYNSTTASATDGTYTLTNLPAGNYKILARAEGYADMWYKGVADQASATWVTPGTQDASNVDFALQAQQ